MTGSDQQELISVILPVYNSAGTIEESVSSVLKQTYDNLELIIVDDASADNTGGICRLLSERDSRIRIITNLSNCGTLKARIRAASEAKSEWIAFIDADDRWHPQKLEKQLALRDSSGSDLVYTASAFIDGSGRPYDWIMHVPGDVSYRQLLKQNIISNSSVLIRRRDYIRYSPPEDNTVNMHEDFACWLCMLRDGLTAHGIDEPLITYRVSKSSSTGSKLKAASMNMNTYRYIGLGFFSRLFYEACYMVNGLRKHRHFR